MTSKEQLIQHILTLSEEDAERLLREWRNSPGGGALKPLMAEKEDRFPEGWKTEATPDGSLKIYPYSPILKLVGWFFVATGIGGACFSYFYLRDMHFGLKALTIAMYLCIAVYGVLLIGETTIWTICNNEVGIESTYISGFFRRKRCFTGDTVRVQPINPVAKTGYIYIVNGRKRRRLNYSMLKRAQMIPMATEVGRLISCQTGWKLDVK